MTWLATSQRAVQSRAVLPVLVAAGMFVVLAAFVAVDPAPGVTASNGPYTDEAWMVLNARNFAVLGQWSTDDWNRHVLSVPYTLIHAAVFVIAGVGIVQARFVEIAATAVTAGVVVVGLRRVADAGSALVGGIAFATCALVLYYGRLSILEPMVALGLTTGAVVLATGSDRRPVLVGAVAGLALAAAIGIKALAIPSVAGILVAQLLVSRGRGPAQRRWVAAVVALGCAAAAWLVLILIPSHVDFVALLRTIPEERLPAGISQTISRVIDYVRQGDGYLAVSWPLVAGGILGSASALLNWGRLGPEGRALLAVAIGWFVAGFGLLAVVSYAPNRYLIPSLPALALLTGLGVHAATLRRPRATRTRVLATLLLTALIAVPGLATYAGWVIGAPATIPTAQAKFAAHIPPGQTVEGLYAPLFAMRSSGPTIFSAFGINPGDLYAERGVRWVVLAEDEVPEWATLHPAAWSARSLVIATTWGPHTIGLYVLP